MRAVVWRVGMLWLLLGFGSPEVRGKSLKIIIPHRISFIHYHHRAPPRGPPRGPGHPRPHDLGDSEEEGPWEGYLAGEEVDEAEEDADYAVPEFRSGAARTRAGFYGGAYERFPVGYEDFLQRLRLPEEPPADGVWF